MAANLLLFLHILFVLIFFGGTVVATVSGFRLATAKDVKEIAGLAQMNQVAEFGLIYPAYVLVGIFGWLTAWQQGWALTGTGWLTASYIVSGVALIMSVAILSRFSMRLKALATESLKQGSVSKPLAQLQASKMPMMVSNFLHILLIFMLVLMVFKPF